MREVDHTVAKTVALVLLFLAALAPAAKTQEIVHLEWPTKIAAEPLPLSLETEKLLPLFRFSATIVPESTLLLSALSMPAAMGISQREAQEMAEPARKRYTAIVASPVFQKTPSAIAYCFSEKKPTLGFANLYLPKQYNKETPVVLFQHGYTGSYQWYLHIMAEAFPDAMLLAPAYGIWPVQMPSEYLFEAMAAAEKKLGFKLRPPTLIGLSAGVPATFRALVTHPERFESLIAIAGEPNSADISKARPGQMIYFLPGGNESYVPTLKLIAEKLQSAGAKVAFDPMPEADHFFLLTRPEESIAKLRAWGLEPEKRLAGKWNH